MTAGLTGSVRGQVSLATVRTVLARHIPLYRTRAPAYQTVLLQALLALWDPTHARVLDVGGGTGIIAQAIKELLGAPHVVSVDVADRFLKSLDIETALFDGETLPFADAAFDCVVLSNVLHHVPPPSRPGLMRECARVSGRGPIYIKDHLATSRLDHARLAVLDLMGNIPFGGMVKASYLAAGDWKRLAAAAGYRIEQRVGGAYRLGAFERLFPNRLEVTMRLVPGDPAPPAAR